MVKVTLVDVGHIVRGVIWEVYGNPNSDFRRIIRLFIWKK